MCTEKGGGACVLILCVGAQHTLAHDNLRVWRTFTCMAHTIHARIRAYIHARPWITRRYELVDAFKHVHVRAHTFAQNYTHAPTHTHIHVRACICKLTPSGRLP